MMAKYFSIAVLFFLFVSSQSKSQAEKNKLIDTRATKETKTLYANLHKLAENHIMFGQQHAIEYGHGWSGDSDRSDVKSVTGSHPAVIGIDFGGLSGRSQAEIDKYKKHLIKTIADIYNQGAVVTAAWHFNNPVSGDNFYWKDSVSKPAVKYIIPGGSYHQQYKQILQTIASVVKNAKGKSGELIPIIFRPYHEFDGYWFWWGSNHTTINEFKQLWRFTVSYLRDSLNVHNFIYAFSPDNTFTTEEKYLERYPGNEWVDIVGIDNYGDFGRYGHYDLEAGFNKLKIVSEYANKSGKLAAFTETGLAAIPDTAWWTEKLLKTLKRENLKLSYVLVWRNDIKSNTEYYAPFPGQVSADDFVKFYTDEYVLFENDLPDMYHLQSKKQITPVQKYGQLHVDGIHLVGSKGEPVVLHGMSFGWHNLWPRFYNEGAVNELVKNWNCSVIRASMGIELNKDGYLQNPGNSVRLIKTVVNACIKNGVYVLIDWHDHNIHEHQAVEFFAMMAKEYHQYPNIIYEIYNEPNDTKTWQQVKPYAENIIKAIRRYDAENIILVGSPHWDQDINLPASDPVKGFKNIMYTMHFYAGTHKQWLRNRTDSAMQKGLPVFISECAATEASGDGVIDSVEWNKYVQWCNQHQLSWIAWSVSDKNESCSVLMPSASSTGNWKEEDVKEWGKLVRKYLNKNYSYFSK